MIDTPDALAGDFPFSIERLGIGVLSVQAPESELVADERSLDVALIRLGHAELDALAEAGRLLRRDPAIEIVFFSDGEDIDLTIAEALGLNRIVPADKLVDWLRLAGPHLVCQTQARRLLLTAARNIPPIPPFAAGCPIASSRCRPPSSDFVKPIFVACSIGAATARPWRGWPVSPIARCAR